MLKLNFSKRLGEHQLDIDTQIPAKGITAVFGVSGAGKTSLINAISGLTQPQRGTIALNARLLLEVENGLSLPPESAASATFSRICACFHTIAYAATCITACHPP